VDQAIYKGNDPKSLVAVYMEIKEPWDPVQSHLFSSLAQLLDIRYTEVLREEMSGVYGMGIDISMVKVPYNHVEISIMIPCSPENADVLTQAALNEIEKIQKNGVAPEDLNKVKEAQRRTLESNLKENRYWLGQLVNTYRLDDPEMITGASARIEAVTSENLQAVAKKIDLNNYVRVVLYPEKK
jgi:zinc protease